MEAEVEALVLWTSRLMLVNPQINLIFIQYTQFARIKYQDQAFRIMGIQNKSSHPACFKHNI